MSVLMQRSISLVLSIVLQLLISFVWWRLKKTRPVVGPLWFVALLNTVFYGFSVAFRAGWFIPPSPFFFTNLSNARINLALVISILVMIPTLADAWQTCRK